MSEQKIYVNSLWFEEKTFADGGSILKLTVLNTDELIKFLKENQSKDKTVRLVVSKKRNIEPNKSTHYAYLDTWQPNSKLAKSLVQVKPKTKTVSEPVEESLI